MTLLSLNRVFTLSIKSIRGTSDEADAVGGVLGLDGKYITMATKIIDLGNDFRLDKDAIYHNKKFVYGLPELQKEVIKKASYIANPGCFATAIFIRIVFL